MISIHAPLTGCDSGWRGINTSGWYFNPRTPYGMRHSQVYLLVYSNFWFQSTHPLRDATVIRSVRHDFSFISIHAPLTGCDIVHLQFLRFPDEFQSTHPLRDATLWCLLSQFLSYHFNPRTPYGMRRGVKIMINNKSIDFNPRTPYGMRLSWYMRSLVHRQISIHAPLTGCDQNFITVINNIWDFNPRTPYGMRLCTFCILIIDFKFQSTHPLRDATMDKIKINSLELEFQSTHPLRDATRAAYECSCCERISIHAPLTGCDVMDFEITKGTVQFQSTHPLRDATCGKTIVFAKVAISIHAPLTGCDQWPLSNRKNCWSISIHAPLTGCDIAKVEKPKEPKKISIHAPLTGCDVYQK